VAQPIVPVDAPNAPERLVADGRVELARVRKRPTPKPINTGATVSDLIGEQRRITYHTNPDGR
jgi:hypothetical protein